MIFQQLPAQNSNLRASLSLEMQQRDGGLSCRRRHLQDCFPAPSAES